MEGISKGIGSGYVLSVFLVVLLQNPKDFCQSAWIHFRTEQSFLNIGIRKTTG